MLWFCDEKIWSDLPNYFLKNTNYYFDFAGCQKETKYSPVSCPNFKSLEFGISNETHLSVTFLPNSLNLNLTNTQVTIRSGTNKNLKPLWPSFSEAYIAVQNRWVLWSWGRFFYWRQWLWQVKFFQQAMSMELHTSK